MVSQNLNRGDCVLSGVSSQNLCIARSSKEFDCVFVGERFYLGFPSKCNNSNNQDNKQYVERVFRPFDSGLLRGFKNQVRGNALL